MPSGLASQAKWLPRIDQLWPIHPAWSSAFLCSFSARNALKNAASDDVFAPLDAGPPDLILNHWTILWRVDLLCFWCQVIGPARALIELLAWIHMMHPLSACPEYLCVFWGLDATFKSFPSMLLWVLGDLFWQILWLFGPIQSWEPGVSPKNQIQRLHDDGICGGAAYSWCES